ncbi:hypothetical protein H112_07844 [Trichophyton rubrum D6]|uniref:Uncharacterized protein n=3 Tax=Trichophyton rubrum TaxID=5551 RepID=A0A178ETR5_TRIRU|nr:uncharacterized protein TERG_08654 [Trichophyton rubrum CBS 118892]EZF10926.1 hypothetical protein H100_07871 [Trichophyton rubrum MR850]EZF37793.1 hypothetical protein H102_07831 [Trichophyton rubrum CBS 100081]EZF48454.1 hypothetical protein H103_07856 [Trichophyton rubrum CBS 288.86]EZF59056.1 hypothetical protein H104_07803 [Trichophyton rubrum CBS 289.86]EZF80415.1 hypothetical protein H110_07854 [Trichophyton rubrum MR1448]EZF91061.1 hypothetical protein H113_07912 [Trichophyton rubr
MENEPEKSPAGAVSSQEETHLHTTSTTGTSTITAPEAEPGPGPTPTGPAATSEDSPSPVPPPPQPQPFPSPYTGHSTSWTGASVPPQETPNVRQPIPPPPKASEMHLYKASTTTTKPPSAHIDTQTHAQHHHIQTLPQQHQRSASNHSNKLPNLEHPPGYRQNPAIAQPSPATLAADGAGFGTGEGPHFGMRQVWDPAPGEAGGRYVYQYDFFGDDEDRDGQAADDSEWLWNSAAGAWETTLSWMKSAGERMAEAEEGIWRWVNSRS